MFWASCPRCLRKVKIPEGAVYGLVIVPSARPPAQISHGDVVVDEYQKNYQKEYRKMNKDYTKQYRATNHIRLWCHGTINNHKKKGIVVNISVDDLCSYAETVKTCMWCGKSIDWSPDRGRVMADSPTLDRVNNSKLMDHIWRGPDDTTEGAVAITCHKCGATKQDRTYTEFVAYCKHVAATHE